jgi:hypothetical protein
MRGLLDECVPKRLRTELTGHSVRTVAEMGWSGSKNGQRLQKAAAEFDCFLTVDRRSRPLHGAGNSTTRQ